MTNTEDQSFIPFLLNFRELRVRGVRMTIKGKKGKKMRIPPLPREITTLWGG